jgi:diacylglycerol kinase family enzyme
MDSWSLLAIDCHLMHPEELASGLSYILERAPALPKRLVGALLVANPKAGGFARPSYAKLRHVELLALKEKAGALPLQEGRPGLELALTEQATHAAEIARDFFAAARASGLNDDEFRLVMAAGGDGTSFEVLSALMELPLEERRHYAVLRLPFGTGNDGSDGRDLIACLGRLLGACSSAPKTAILVTPKPEGGKLPIWCFNIASFGVDAYISHMTNKFKAVFPGDFYKLWVDIASIFYDLAWPSSELAFKAFGAGGEAVRDFKRLLLLLAVGATGHRQYGSNKAILPDDDNVCAISQMSLLRKLAVKGPLQRGEHRSFPEADLFSAVHLVVDYADRLLFQADGEVTRFETSDFPATMDLVPEAYLALDPS